MAIYLTDFALLCLPPLFPSILGFNYDLKFADCALWTSTYCLQSFRDFLFKKCHLWCVNFCNLNSLSQVHPCDKSSLLSVSMLHLAKLCLCKWKRYKVLSEVGDKGMPSGNWCDAFRSLVRKKETMQRNLEGLKLGKVCCCSAELIYLLSGRFLDSSGKLQ